MRNLHSQIYCKVKIFLLGLLCVSGIACENEFDPLQENDRYVFSMYGAFDIHADTNWVRVMPIAETLIPRDPESNGTTVTMIHQRTGEETQLQPKLLRFSGNVYVWNYWTTKELEPQEEYMIRAEAPGGNQSFAIITIPSELDIPDVTYSGGNEEGEIRGTSEDTLVTMDFRYFIQVIRDRVVEPEVEVIISNLDDINLKTNGDYCAQIDNAEKLEEILLANRGDMIVNRRELVVISSSEDWPDIADLSEEEIVLPDAVSNVVNGTGFIAGIAKRKIVITSKRASAESAPKRECI